jgi:octaprenyl-diphosphate synthase
LLLLSAKLLDYQGQGAVRLGAVVEIIHTATLVHDDIIDEAKTRRGRPAANTQWGNSKCVLAGDWLYMQAFKIAVQERNFRILDTLIELTQQMVEGELLQVEKLGKLITLDEHFDLIFRKTACLFSVCMRLGAILGGATAEQEAALGQYGHNATMAVIHALERCTPQERSKIETVLRHGAFNGVTHAEILEILQHYGSLEAATARAAYYAESARKSICTFPDTEIKRALLWAPEFVVAREK